MVVVLLSQSDATEAMSAFPNYFGENNFIQLEMMAKTMEIEQICNKPELSFKLYVLPQ